MCWCGFDTYSPSLGTVVVPFPIPPILPYPPVLQEFVDDIPRHANECTPLQKFTPVGFYKRGLPVTKYSPPPFRPFLTLGMATKRKEKIVYPISFLVDTGSPQTYLNKKTIEDLLLEPKPFFTHTGFSLYYKKIHVACAESQGHFEALNVVGTDLLWYGKLEIDFEKQHLKFET